MLQGRRELRCGVGPWWSFQSTPLQLGTPCRWLWLALLLLQTATGAAAQPLKGINAGSSRSNVFGRVAQLERELNALKAALTAQKLRRYRASQASGSAKFEPEPRAKADKQGQGEVAAEGQPPKIKQHRGKGATALLRPAKDPPVLKSKANQREQGFAECVVLFILVGVSPGTTASGSILLIDEQLNITAEMAQPGCRVHVLTDSDEIIQRIRRLAAAIPWGERLVVKNVTPLLVRPRKTFLHVYRHQSVNDREYEAYCFWRWGVYVDYLQELAENQGSVSRVFTLDADIVPTRPIIQWLPLDLDVAFGKNISVVQLSMGAVILWTPEELTNFWNYMLRLYEVRGRTKAWVDKFGIPLNCTGPRYSQVLPCKGPKQLHVSDMMAFQAFAEENKAARVTVPLYADWLYLWALSDRAPLHFNLDPYACFPVNVAKTFRNANWTMTVSGGPDSSVDPRTKAGWSLVVPHLERPLCYVHFQGGTKWAIKPLSNLIDNRVNGTQFWFKR